jgi:Kef-type K+ transport system membrane component KefB/nucleotide-binding universal stress UspA family protein
MPHFELSDVILVLAQIAAILVLSRTLGLVTRWLQQPLVVAEVLAGIMLGPSVLGLVWPDAMNALFPPSSFSVLKMLSQIGLVLFMFFVGLELDPKLLKGRTHSSIAISHTSIVVPFGLGALAAWWLYDGYAPDGVSFVSFMLFIGAAMSVTAFPVLARILSERQLMGTRVGAIAIACAAVDDVTAWCILAFVVAVARARGIESAIWTTGFALAFIVAMIFLVRPFLRRVGARVANAEGLTQTVVAFVLLGLIASAMLSELIGIHALFGAFLFGAVLPKEGRFAQAIADKLETIAVVLLLPLFFAYSGLRTEIGLVTQPQHLLVTAAIIAIATLGKFGGSVVAGRLTGMRWREASAIGILMNTRGLMELVVLNLGMDLGVISPTLFTMMVIMALATTVATTPVLRLVYPERELMRERAEPAGEPAGAPFTVMMCVSHASSGPALATVAAALSAKAETAARLVALHLWRPVDRPSVELGRRDSDPGAPLAPLLERARELEIEIDTKEFVSSEPADDIVRTAETEHASLVLIGAHKPLLLEGRFGGVVNDVVERANVPVAVLLDRGVRRIENVLVAFAGGVDDLSALELGRRLAGAPRSKLTVLHVVAPAGQSRSDGQAQIERVFGARERDSSSFRMRVIEHASPGDALLEEASDGYDLVVLGMHEHWSLERGALGLGENGVLSECKTSILAVHPPARVSAPEPRSEPLASVPDAT